MNKAATSSAARLGTKRACPKCATKFYDFNKEELACPKCGTEIDLSNPVVAPVKAAPPEPKKPARSASSDDDEESDSGSGTSSDFESMDDLDSDEEDVVEDLGVDDDGDEDEY